MLKTNLLPISCASTLIFVTGLLAFGCSPFMMNYAGICAAFFSIGTVCSVFVFAAAVIAKIGSGTRGVALVVMWVFLLIGYFVELRHILANVCLK